MTYFIKRTNQQGKVSYKKNKCVDGWSTNKTYCWRFSKQGARQIIKRLEECEARKKPFMFNGIELMPDKFTYALEEAE